MKKCGMAVGMTALMCAMAIGQTQPTLVSPLDGAVNSTPSPTFTWNAYSGAVSYRLQISYDPTFALASMLYNQVGPNTQLSRQVSGVYYGPTCYWRIAAVLASGGQIFSASWSFSNGVPGPTLISPANGTTNGAVSPTLTWNAFPRAVSYHLLVAQNPSLKPPLDKDQTGIVGTSWQVFLNPNTQYFWGLTAVDSLGGTSRITPAWDFTTGTPPAQPTLLSPPDRATGVSTNPVMIWTAAAGASSYRLVVMNQFEATVVDSPGLTGTSLQVTGLADTTFFNWYVEATNAAGSTSSNFFSFRTALSPPPQTTLVSPKDGSTGVPTSLNLTWNATPGAATYRLQVSTDPGFGTTFFDQSGIKGTVQPITGLSEGTVYHWRVNGTNAAGPGPFSAAWSFTTLVTPPPAPSLLSPADSSTDVSTSPTFSWNSATGATSYRLQVSANANFSPTVYDQAGIVGTSQQGPSLSFGTVYYWRVSGANAGGPGSYSTVWTFTTIVAAPPTPTLLQPADGSTGVSTGPTFRWNAATGAVTYGLQVSTSPSFGSTVFDQSGIKGTAQVVPGLSSGTLYYWRVNATNPGGSSAYSTTWGFTTLFIPPLAPVLASPLDGSTGVSTNPTLSWNAASGATSYRLQVSTNANFSPTVLDTSAIAGTSYPVTGLSNSTVYYWRVDAANPGGSGPYSTAWSFTTTAVPPPAAPALAAPADGATGVSTSPTLSWNTVTGATSYRLQVSTNPNFSPTTFDSAGISVTLHQLTGLPNSTVFYWRVNAANVGGAGPYSTAWSFTTAAIPPPLQPTLASPGDGATGVSASPTLSWIATTGATSYRLQVSTNVNFSSTVFDQGSITGTSQQVTGLSNGTAYYWRVNGANAGGPGPYSVIWSFATIPSPPTAPTLTFPPDGATAVLVAPTISWNAVNGATSYQLQVSGNANFSSTVFDQTGITGTSQAVTGLSNATLYYWRVNAANTGGASPYSAVRSFTTIVAPPLAPVLSLPANGATGVSTTPTLSWSAVSGAASYRLQVATNANFSPTILDQAGIVGTSRQLTGLSNTTLCYWRVNAANAGGTSPNSAVWSFTTERPLFILTPTYDKPSAGSVLNISMAIPAGFQPTSSILHFRNGGQRTYQTANLSLNGNNLTGVIPSNYLNLRGIEYYVIVTDGIDSLRYPGPPVIDPANNPALITVDVAIQAAQITPKKQTYKMISVPMRLDDAQVRNVLVDDLGEYNVRHWRLFRWNNVTLNEYPNIDSGFTPGTAFWLRTYDGRGFDVEKGHSINSRIPYTIVIRPGWNQIANPFAFPVAWDSITNSNRLRRPYFYDGTQYQPGTNVLQPWEGYFVLGDSSGPVTLSIPPVEASPTIPKYAASAGKIDSEVEYQLQLSAGMVGTDLEDTYNYLGFLGHAEGGSDKVDYPEPPPIGDYVQLSIVEGQDRFMSNFKPLSPDGQRWEFQLRSTLPHERVQITLVQSGTLPEGFRVYVLDQDSYNIIPLTDWTFSVQLGGEQSVRTFSVIIGTQVYAEKNSGGIPLTPFAFALEQNFPNPFNPTTNIRYQLSKRTNVLLQVYNLLGQRVRNLVDGEQTTGTYSVMWDGTSDGGSPAATGVYLCRLQVESYTAVRKLILMK